MAMCWIECKNKFYKKFSELLVYCYISGLILYISDIEKIKIYSLDVIKSNEFFNLLYSVIADLLAFIPFIYYRKINKFSSNKKIPENNNRSNLIYNVYKMEVDQSNTGYLLLFSSILEFLDRSLILIYLFVREDKKVYDIQFIWIFSFDYAFRCIFYFIFKKLKINDYLISNIYIFNFLLLLTNGIISLYIYLYHTNQNLQIFHLILIFSKVLIKIIIDNLNYNLIIFRYLSPLKIMFARGLIDFVFFIILSVVLYIFSDAKKWMLSSLSDLNVIKIILSKILYTLSFGIQKMFLLLIINKENPILASFSSLIYYFEPYISMIIMYAFYYRNIEKGNLEMIFDAISLICFLFSYAISIEIIIFPCGCLNKGTKYFTSKRGISDEINKDNDSESVSQEVNADGAELNALE